MGEITGTEVASEKNEAARVAAVEALDLFGESADLTYDDAVYLASLICGTPISLVSVLEKTQRFKAKIGIEVDETPKEESFCIHTIRQPGLFIVPDARIDDRFCDLPLVTENPNVRFYAGVTLSTLQGDAVGALCVCDVVPRELNEQQKVALEILSRQVAARFEDRQKMKEMARIIAEKERIEKDLQNSHALFNAFMDNSPLLSYMKNESGRFIYYNQAFVDHFKITGDQWIGLNERDFFPDEDGRRLVDMDREIFCGNQLSVRETSVPGIDRAEHIWKAYKFNFVNAAGERFLVALCHEITGEKAALQEVDRYHRELQKANDRLRELSLTDPLTGCWNRRAFDERLQRESASIERHGGAFSILMLDIDNFKKVNDTHGHHVGDQVLCHVARVLKKEARGTDFVCRFGGEEFAIILTRTTKAGAGTIAQRLLRSVSEESEGVAVTVSIGVGDASSNDCDGVAVIRRADEALYEAKSAGKNCVVLAA